MAASFLVQHALLTIHFAHLKVKTSDGLCPEYSMI